MVVSHPVRDIFWLRTRRWPCGNHVIFERQYPIWTAKFRYQCRNVGIACVAADLLLEEHCTLKIHNLHHFCADWSSWSHNYSGILWVLTTEYLRGRGMRLEVKMLGLLLSLCEEKFTELARVERPTLVCPNPTKFCIGDVDFLYSLLGTNINWSLEITTYL